MNIQTPVLLIRGVENKKELSPPPENPKTPCSNGHISRSTHRILLKMTPLESTRRVLSNGSIYTKIQPVVREIWSFESDA